MFVVYSYCVERQRVDDSSSSPSEKTQLQTTAGTIRTRRRNWAGNALEKSVKWRRREPLVANTLSR